MKRIEAVKEEPVIIWQDTNLAVMSKSAGWIVAISRHIDQSQFYRRLLADSGQNVPATFHQPEHLCHFIALKFKDDSSFRLSNDLSHEWGIAHRLDVDTSGAIMLGKTQEGYHHLREAFSSRTVFKEYICLVHGAVQNSGEVNHPIYWDSSTNTSYISAQSGDWAQTFFSLVGHYRLKGCKKIFSLCRVVIITGRTHQIRVHMSGIGHPLVSDSRYNLENSKADLLWCPRIFLHAWRLGFYDLSWQWQEVRTSLASDLQRALRMLTEIKLDMTRPDDPSYRTVSALKASHIWEKEEKVKFSVPSKHSWPQLEVSANDHALEDSQTNLEDFCQAAAKVLADASDCQLPLRLLTAHPDLEPFMEKMGMDRQKVSRVLRDRPDTFIFLGSGRYASIVALVHDKIQNFQEQATVEKQTPKTSRKADVTYLAALAAMGFDDVAAEKALQANKGNFIEAMEQLAEQAAVEDCTTKSSRGAPAPPKKISQGDEETAREDLKTVLILSEQEEARRQKNMEFEEELLRMALEESRNSSPSRDFQKDTQHQIDLEKAMADSRETELQRLKRCSHDDECMTKDLADALMQSQEFECKRTQKIEDSEALKKQEEEEMLRAMRESSRFYELFYAVEDEEAALESILNPVPSTVDDADLLQLAGMIQSSYSDAEDDGILVEKAEAEQVELQPQGGRCSHNDWDEEWKGHAHSGPGETVDQTSSAQAAPLTTSAELLHMSSTDLDSKEKNSLVEDQSRFSLREFIMHRHAALQTLGDLVEFDTLWAVLSELDEEHLSNEEVLKMWFGYSPEGLYRRPARVGDRHSSSILSAVLWRAAMPRQCGRIW